MPTRSQTILRTVVISLVLLAVIGGMAAVLVDALTSG
jgi:hypothetical protein